MRIKIFRIVIIVLFITVAVNLIYLQVFRGKYYYRLSKNNRIRVVALEGWRGKITDRNGVVMADNTISFNVLITPQDIKDFNELFEFISSVLRVDQKKLVQIYHQRKSAPFAPVMIAQDIDRDKALVLEENKYRFPSMIIEEGFKRFYPLGKSSAHVIGYVGKTDHSQIEHLKEYGYAPSTISGKTGIEQYYDTYLMGVAGGLQVEVNSRGQQVRLLSIKEAQRGENVQLTIDSGVQNIIYEELQERTGAVVMIDMDSGEVLGMVSSPSFDPNYFTDSRLMNQTSNYFRDSRAPLLDRVTKGQYPPGSVFKIPVAISALDQKKTTVHTSFVCPGYHELGGAKFGCTHVHGNQNLIEAIAHSCNVYFYRLGLIVGGDIISRYAKVLGLGKLTHIDLPYEKQGFIPSKKQRLLQTQKRWYPGDTLNLSIGQGQTLVTPLQLAVMIATVANDGVETQPRLLYAVGGKKIEHAVIRRHISIPQDILKIIKQGLRAAVSDFSGTANVLNLKEVYVAGKTGTAQTSGNKEHHAWFAGYAKGENRNIAFCVFLEHGGSSRNACLLAREILLKMYQEKLI